MSTISIQLKEAFTNCHNLWGPMRIYASCYMASLLSRIMRQVRHSVCNSFMDIMHHSVHEDNQFATAKETPASARAHEDLCFVLASLLSTFMGQALSLQ